MTKDADIFDDQFAQFIRYSQESDHPAANLRRAQLLGITAENARVAPGAIVRLHAEGAIGRNCFIGLYGYVNGIVVLEDDVILGPHCSITSNTHIFDPATQAFTKSAHRAVRIGRGTWLCASCSVTSGVSVGKANLICANAVVTKDTEDFAIMAGVPAAPVGRIDPTTGAYHWNSRGEIPR